MRITIDRAKHSLAVARKMKEIVLENSSHFNCNAEDMYILGLVHDVGYEFVEKQEDHPKMGGEILRNQGYKYWKEVYYHGIPQTEYSSVELNLLNYVDLITGSSGVYISIEKRISNIAKRYGKGSIQELDAIKLADSLHYTLFPAHDQKER